MAKVSANKKSNTLMLTVMAMLTAVIFLFGLTPIGYLKIGIIEITFLQLPVIIGALLYGWKAGALLGAMFGITSFIQCFGMSPFGAMLLGINPLLTAFVCLVPRVLMGFCTGLIASAFKKNGSVRIEGSIVPSLAGALLNTLFFMTALILCFWNTEYIQGMASTILSPAATSVSATDLVSVTDIVSVADIASATDLVSSTDASVAAVDGSFKNILIFCVAFVGINGLIEAVVCAILGAAIGPALYKVQQKLAK